jgi:hypothetical protein
MRDCDPDIEESKSTRSYGADLNRRTIGTAPSRDSLALKKEESDAAASA